ncbi:MCP four helix bundle domain-containing protein [Heliobacterium chlorum]|uniref:MCP four helix bundle domain-containing protein n=1 Tax=Heliobacterium chlorum TaxID=2698 RepID=A0ABR7T2K2_HELCL|nr:MCP four helix bundle domain-containing protein [Heliobacterium chlorum]MBC9784998.1 MCP four helix bundle domain-containing protein [Heliobacterium chlorum]
MQTFRNFSTATKIISLIVLMSIFMLGVELVGYSYTHVVSSNMQAMYHDSLLPVKWLNQVRADNRLVEELTLKIMLTDQDKNTENVSLSKINEQIQEIMSLLNEFETTNLDTFESEKLTLIKKKLDDYGVEHQKALNLPINGQKSIAYAEFSKNATPLMMDVNASLNELAEYKSKTDESAQNDSKDQRWYCQTGTNSFCCDPRTIGHNGTNRGFKSKSFNHVSGIGSKPT